MRVRGSFAAKQMHEWLSGVVPEMSGAPAADGAGEVLLQNVYTGSLLSARYGDGSAVLSSGCAATIAVLKERLSKAGIADRVALHLDVQSPGRALEAFVEALRGRFQRAVEVQRNHGVLPAVGEVIEASAELPPDGVLLSIWAAREDLEAEAPLAREAAAYIADLLVDAFLAHHRLVHHEDGRRHVPALLRLLGALDFEGAAALVRSATAAVAER